MKTKKVLALLMASTMTMSLAACGTSNPAGTVATDTESEADDAADAVEEAAEEAPKLVADAEEPKSGSAW